jgi:hypothetical protein
MRSLEQVRGPETAGGAGFSGYAKTLHTLRLMH